MGSRFKVPAPPGHEGVGIVRKLGAGVRGFEEGDRVAFGGFATCANGSAQGMYKIPPGGPADEYWLVEPVACAVTGLDHCRLRAGDRVVVIGCGFMGLLLIQGLVRSPAAEIVAVDIEPHRLELARSFGVREVFNTSEIPVQEVAARLKDRQIDTVVDASGSQQGLDLAADVVKRGGLINLFGWIKGETAAFDPSAWHMKGLTIVNSSPSARLREVFPVAIDLIRTGLFDLRPLVTHIVTLEEYPGLMKRILAGDKTYIKGVVRLAGES
jgi:threonine dehydrogenase-like Zn-dependent dehydrogenase